jgi:hypothetical protein
LDDHVEFEFEKITFEIEKHRSATYRYLGPFGPITVGFANQDQSTWIDGPSVGPATLDCGPVSLLGGEDQSMLARGVPFHIGNRTIELSVPANEYQMIVFTNETSQWVLEPSRYKGFNRCLFRVGLDGFQDDLIGCLHSGSSNKSFTGLVAEDIDCDEVGMLVISWASFLGAFPKVFDPMPSWSDGPPG